MKHLESQMRTGEDLHRTTIVRVGKETTEASRSRLTAATVSITRLSVTKSF